jgi:hypothetical protein
MTKQPSFDGYEIRADESKHFGPFYFLHAITSAELKKGKLYTDCRGLIVS